MRGGGVVSGGSVADVDGVTGAVRLMKICRCLLSATAYSLLSVGCCSNSCTCLKARATS